MPPVKQVFTWNASNTWVKIVALHALNEIGKQRMNVIVSGALGTAFELLRHMRSHQCFSVIHQRDLSFPWPGSCRARTTKPVLSAATIVQDQSLFHEVFARVTSQHKCACPCPDRPSSQTLHAQGQMTQHACPKNSSNDITSTVGGVIDFCTICQKLLRY